MALFNSVESLNINKCNHPPQSTQGPSSLTILPTENYNLPFIGHKIPYLSSLLVSFHQSSRLYDVMYNPFLVYCRELAPGTVSLTDDRAQGDDSKHDSLYSYSFLGHFNFIYVL